MNETTQQLPEPSTDYLIIGAGSAGCVLANRLSADGKHQVSLLEAGGSHRNFWVSVPLGYGKTFFDEKFNWKYQTEPDAALQNRSLYWPRGKVLGGSSSINAMVYIRGHERDFDDWAERGNPGWSFNDVLPYFVKSEDSEFEPGKYHGSGGPLHVTRIEDQVHPLCNTWMKAAQEYGFDTTDDFNGGKMEGAGIYSITTRDGYRESTATAFLNPARKRPNLDVHTKAKVEKILFDGNKAVGVLYRQHGKLKTLTARREVILSAGAVNSPQLLELSGIGDKSILEKFDITPVHINANVGEHLQDHLGVNYVYRSKVPTLNDELHSVWGKLRAGIKYLLTRKGHLSLSVNQSGGFVKSDPTQKHPNLQLYFAALSYSTTNETHRRRLMNPDPYSAYILSFQPCRPTSRGSIHIQSSSADQAPAIAPNYLSSNEDISDVLGGCRLMRELAATPSLAAITDEELEPGASLQDDEQLLDDFRQRSGTVFHPVGTCAMGPDPQTAVVDSELRVYGVQGLRVVDASIFPSITSGNTNAPTIMVAEKAADMILQSAEA